MSRTPGLLRKQKATLQFNQQMIIVLSNLAWIAVVVTAFYVGSALWAVPALVTMCTSMAFHATRYVYIEVMDTFFAALYFFTGITVLLYVHPLSEVQALLFLASIALGAYFLAHVFRVQRRFSLYTAAHATWHVSAAVLASGVYWTLLQ